MKKQLQQKTTLLSDKQEPTPHLDKLIEDYFRVCEETGKKFNGLEKAHFTAIVRQYYIAEHILEIADMIRNHDFQKECLEKLQNAPLARANPNPNPMYLPIKEPTIVPLGVTGGDPQSIGITQPNGSSGGILPDGSKWKIEVK